MTDNIMGLAISVFLAILAAYLFRDGKKTIHSEHHTLTIMQAFSLLCLKLDMLGPTGSQYRQLSRWKKHGHSGTVQLPILGFDSWEEYQAALSLTSLNARARARQYNIEITFTSHDVERVWRTGYDNK
jgi:hypothetical protein